MSVNITNIQIQQYSGDLRLLLQQQGSRLRGKTMEGTHTGKQASPVDQMGAVTAQTPAARFAPKNRVDADLTRRWVFPIDKDVPQLVDEFDLLRILEDPKMQYVKNAANAIGRAWDDAIIDAFFADAKVGETGSGTDTFDTANYSIASNYNASAAVGLTVDKMIKAQEIFETANVDLEQETVTLVIGPKQHADLLRQVQITSADYNPMTAGNSVLQNGRVRKFLGMDVIVSTRLKTVSSERAVACFLKSGMYLGVWRDLNTNISKRTDLSSEPWDIYANATFGATRLEEGRVIRVLCAES